MSDLSQANRIKYLMRAVSAAGERVGRLEDRLMRADTPDEQCIILGYLEDAKDDYRAEVAKMNSVVLESV